MKKKYYLIILLAVVMVLALALSACEKKPVTDPSFEWDEYTAPAPSQGTDSVNLPAVPSGKASSPSVQIHYQRQSAADYGKWTLWLWTESGSIGSSDDTYGWKFNYKDDWGVIALYSLEDLGKLQGGSGNYQTSEAIGFLVRDASWGKDVSSDRFWTLGEIDENNYYHLYLVQGDSGLYSSIEDIQYGMSAGFVSEKQITINTSTPVTHVAIYEGDTVIAETDTDETTAIRYNIPDSVKLDLSKNYKTKVKFVADNKEKECNLSIIPLYGTKMFEDAYCYDGELGAIYTQNSTEFKVWSPFSSKIVLKLYEAGNGGTAYITKDMTKGDKGVWSVKVDGDLKGKYYTYTVTNDSYNGKEIVDPYAKSAGLNGQRGQIVNFAETNPEGWKTVKPIDYDRNELVVWETHVADVTSSSTWGGSAKNAKKFLGLIETGTTYTEGDVTVTTGFDHIKELGVNAVQFVPIFDQANDEANPQFNWGYNPLNYNVLEGSYSSDPTDGYARIREFKQVVQAYNEAGINIIMDVVYNHVSAAVGSNFDVLCPGYYFRYSANGDMANGSGCGNETASDHYMFRKFMIDSVSFWASEYKLGGFRFDLMGLHDIDTMNQLYATLKEINPSIVVYGEPWTGGTSPLASNKMANQANGNSLVGVGQFNDQMRDALIKGGMNSADKTGWVTTGSFNSGDFSKILYGMRGAVDIGSMQIDDMTKVVNYVTCHDNYTLYDRVFAALGTQSKAYIEQMCVLANSVVLTSNGIGFMLAGEEFLRSKRELGATGDAIHNSYEAGYRANELDYSRKIKYAKVFDSYKKLVEFKTSFAQFGLEAAKVNSDMYSVEQANSGAVVVATIKTTDRTYKVIHANFDVSNYTAKLEGYTLVLDTLGETELTASTAIQPFQTIIAYK